MGIGDIIGDALAYPFQNVKALLLYVVLGVIAAIIGGGAVLSLAATYTSKGLGGYAFGGLSIVGIILFVLVLFLIEGYGLDIIKFGIERRNDAPGIDIGRQISNAIKLVVVSIVYYVIPAIIIAFVINLNNIIGSILLGIFVVYFVFFYNRAIGLLYAEAN